MMAEEKKKKAAVKKTVAAKEKMPAKPRKKAVKADEVKVVHAAELKAAATAPAAPAVAEAKTVVTPEPVKFISQPAKPKTALPKGTKYYGTGRRKEAMAKVWLAEGTGKFVINGKSLLEYFCGRKVLECTINRPLLVAKVAGKYDVYAQLIGGGVPSQADAIRLGIARALVASNAELKSVLKREGLLTRDPRMKERKKYGLKRARRAFQYTKR